MTRHCFTLQVRPDALDKYRERHASVWPEMMAALHAAGWRHYTLHLRADGLLVGIVHAEDLQAAQSAMAAAEVNTRWQAQMASLFADLPDGRPDQGFTLLETVFDLDAQLSAYAQLGDAP